MNQDLVDRLRIRATIRRQAKGRKSIEEGKPDRLADLLEEAANEIEVLRTQKLKMKEILNLAYGPCVVNWKSMHDGDCPILER